MCISGSIFLQQLLGIVMNIICLNKYYSHTDIVLFITHTNINVQYQQTNIFIETYIHTYMYVKLFNTMYYTYTLYCIVMHSIAYSNMLLEMSAAYKIYTKINVIIATNVFFYIFFL